MMAANNNVMLGIIVASIVGVIGGTNAYAADIIMSVGETKWVSFGRGAYDIKSSDSNIVSIDSVITRAGFTEVKLTCKNAGTVTISYRIVSDNKVHSKTVICSSSVIPETPVGLISLIAGSFAALYIFTRIKGRAR